MQQGYKTISYPTRFYIKIVLEGIKLRIDCIITTIAALTDRTYRFEIIRIRSILE
jgi:hypothetical protein